MASLDDLFNDAKEEKQPEPPKKENIQPKKAKKKLTKCKIALRIFIILLVIAGIGFSIYGSRVRWEEDEIVYQNAMDCFESGDYATAISMFKTIEGHEDASEKISEVEYTMNKEVYDLAMSFKEAKEWDSAIELFNEIANFEDASTQIEECNSLRRTEYIEYIGLEVYKLNKYKEMAISLCTEVDTAWSKAVESGKDATVALQSLYKQNEATIKTLKSAEKGLDEQITPIETLEGAENAYEIIVSMYDTYKQIYSQAIAPTGTNEDYSRKWNDYSDEFDSMYYKLRTDEPEAAAIIDAEVKKEYAQRLEEEEKILGNKS